MRLFCCTWLQLLTPKTLSAGTAVLCCAVLCCAVLCCAVLCCAVLCCAVLCCAVLCCAVLCCAVLCCAVLCCAVLTACCVMLDSAASSQSQSIKVPAAQSECHSQSRQNQSLPASTQAHCAVLASGVARSCCASAAVWTPQNRLWIWTAPHSWPSFSTCLKAHQSSRLPATAHRPRMWPQLWLIVTCCQLGCCCRAAS